jgi:hypothetical protein
MLLCLSIVFILRWQGLKERKKGRQEGFSCAQIQIFNGAEYGRNPASLSTQKAATPNRRFQFHERSQLFIRAQSEALTKRGVDLISEALPFGRLWYGEPDAVSNAIDYAKFRSRSHHAVIRVFDEAGNVIETNEHAGQFKEW